MTPSKIFSLAKAAINAWIDDFAPSMGAAISYYTVFSIAPLLVIVIAVAGAVFGDEAVRGSLQAQMAGLVGDDGATAIQGLVADARHPDEGLLAGGISLVILLVGATTVFGEIQSALDRIWHVPEQAKPSGIWGLLRARILSFGLILGLAFLLMTSLAVSAAVAAVGSWFGSFLPAWELLLQAVNLAISLVVGIGLFAMIYKLMPSVPIAWRDVWVGSAVTACLFEVGKMLIGLYMGKAGISSSYAAAGSIAVILIWVYYAAQVFLLGAEFTKVYAADRLQMASPMQGQAPTAAAGAATTTAKESTDTKAQAGSTPPALLPAIAAPLTTRIAVKACLTVASLVLKFWLKKRQHRARR